VSILPQTDDVPRAPIAGGGPDIDTSLMPILYAEGVEQRRDALENVLVTIAAPVVRAVVRNVSLRFGPSARLRPEDEEDIAATTMYRLVRRLSTDLSADPISSFRQYVAGVAKHVCDDHFRALRSSRAAIAEQSSFADEQAPLELPAPPSADPVVRYELMESITAVWETIQLLPHQQRMAVLLNLKDGHGNTALRYVLASGIATMDDIAAALGVDDAKLLQWWPLLPLPDAQIADYLGVSRQRIINLRQAARKRLRRTAVKVGW
jgi:RNA polymerase sigma factor (sigma-70 family)